MTTAQSVEMSVTVNNSPIRVYFHPDDHTQPTYDIFIDYLNIIQISCVLSWDKHLLTLPLINITNSPHIDEVLVITSWGNLN